MPKRAISVTIDSDNLLWLQGQSRAGKRRSVSDALNQLITEARTSGRQDATIRSVRGTVDIDPADPLLETADAYIRSLFDASLNRPLLVRERPLRYGDSRPTRRRRRRG